MMNMMGKLFRSTLVGNKNGQSTTEFAFMFPVFVVLLIGLASVSLLFYSYLTAHLAVREGAGALVRDASQTIYQIRTIVCNSTFALNRSQVFVQVDPSPNGLALIPCSSLDASEGICSACTYGRQVQVSVYYNVPLPTVSLPAGSGGTNAVFLGPIQIKAESVMTIQ